MAPFYHGCQTSYRIGQCASSLKAQSHLKPRSTPEFSQGTVLGPLLSLCHINDLPERVTSTVRLFADYCLLYRDIHSERDKLELQKDLESLERWAEEWGMRFNAKKCYIMHISPKHHKHRYMYNIGGHVLESVMTIHT